MVLIIFLAVSISINIVYVFISSCKKESKLHVPLKHLQEYFLTSRLSNFSNKMLYFTPLRIGITSAVMWTEGEPDHDSFSSNGDTPRRSDIQSLSLEEFPSLRSSTICRSSSLSCPPTSNTCISPS